MVKRRPYEEIQQLVEQHGGTMKVEREGHQWAAWVVRIGNKRRVLESTGSGYPALDRLYVPKPGISNPSHWSDYSNTLIPDAWDKFIAEL